MMQENNKENNSFLSSIRTYLNRIKSLLEKDKNADYSSIMKEIWKLSKKKFVADVKERQDFKPYKGIIYTVGFSPEPIILNLLANEPHYAYFIYTKESERYIDPIIAETRLKPSQFKRDVIARDSAAESFNLVKKGLKYLTEEKGLDKSEVALDPTGGTKIMSVGCGIAASIFNLDVLYVNNENYNPELRRPEPGSEILVRVPNPFDIYQDAKLIEALNRLKTQHFFTAKEAFYAIKQASSKPLLPEILATISEILYYWDSIDYLRAKNSIEKSKMLIEKLGTKISTIKGDLIGILESWENYLSCILNPIEGGKEEVEKISPYLIYDIKQNADREFFASNYNNAALKYYRVIEMINQFVLFKNCNINTQDPDYKLIPEDIREMIEENKGGIDLENAILKEYNALWNEIYKKQNLELEYKESNLLPRKIGLIAGIILRYILGDSSVNTEFIFDILNAVEKRNSSIFAHGIESIRKKDCEQLKKISEKMILLVKLDQRDQEKSFSKRDVEKLIELFVRVI